MKTSLAVFVVVVVVVLASVAHCNLLQPRSTCDANSQHEFASGCDDPATLGKPIERTTRTIPAPTWFWQQNIVNVFIPDTGSSTDKVIQCVRVIDMIGNKRGGCPRIARGGSGFTSVQLELTSQKGKEMSFYIEVLAVNE